MFSGIPMIAGPLKNCKAPDSGGKPSFFRFLLNLFYLTRQNYLPVYLPKSEIVFINQKTVVESQDSTTVFGGGEGSRTPVRKQFHGMFSGRRRLFRAALPPCSPSARQAVTPAGQVRVMMRGQVNSFPPHGRHINDAFPGLWPLRFRRPPT